MLIALAVDVSGEINISTKKEGLGSLEGLLNVIADSTQSPMTDTVNGNPISGIAVYWRLEVI